LVCRGGLRNPGRSWSTGQLPRSHSPSLAEDPFHGKAAISTVSGDLGGSPVTVDGVARMLS